MQIELKQGSQQATGSRRIKSIARRHNATALVRNAAHIGIKSGKRGNAALCATIPTFQTRAYLLRTLQRSTALQQRASTLLHYLYFYKKTSKVLGQRCHVRRQGWRGRHPFRAMGLFQSSSSFPFLFSQFQVAFFEIEMAKCLLLSRLVSSIQFHGF